MATALKRMTVQEFEAWSAARPNETHELVDGIPRAMAGPGLPHATMQAALIAAIHGRLRPPCRVVGQVGYILDDYNERVPDIAVVCRSLDEPRLRDASIVVEILSESTAAVDLGEKRLRYMQMAGRSEIWIVAADRRHVMRWSRPSDGGWTMEDLTDDEPAAIASPLLAEPLPLRPLWASVGL